MAGEHWYRTATGGASGVDAVELRRALGLLMAEGEAHEVRALPSGRSRLVRGNDLDAAVKAVEELAEGSTGVYLTCNPVRGDLEKAASNRDVTRRRLFYVDIDPIRPKGTNATEAEHDAARGVADDVRAALDALGWPSPIVVDSGSGWHLHYLVDLPASDHSRSIISRALKALAVCHDTPGVLVDPKVSNASRIVRLPGTTNRKGPNTPDRPHRPCRLVSVPASFEPVNVDLLKAVAGLESDPGDRDAEPATRDRPGPSDAWTKRADDGAIAYAKGALRSQLAELAGTTELRNDHLYESALKLGGYVASGLLEESEVVRALSVVGRGIGLGSDGDPLEVDRAIRNGLDAGLQTPKQAPESTPAGKVKGKVEPATVDAETGKRTYPFPLIIKGSAIVPKKVDWLWPGRVPIGFLTLLAGRTSVGKSFVTFDFVARLTSGEELPDAIGGNCLEPSNTLIISEDSAEYVIAPRLIELGADMDRVAVMTFEAMARFELDNIDMLDDLYAEAGSPRLVVIDPPTNFLGAKDEHKNAVVRGVLMGISIWTMRHDLACMMITHCNKGIKKDMSALDRIIGSVAWASTSRLAHILAPDPDDTTRCLFVPLKNNIGELAKGWSYRIRKTEECAVVDWLGPVDMTGDQALYGEAKPRRITAAEWLIARFREQRQWRSADLFAAAKEANVSRDAIFEAKQVLGLPTARKHISENGDVAYVWWVPDDWPRLAEEAPS